MKGRMDGIISFVGFALHSRANSQLPQTHRLSLTGLPGFRGCCRTHMTQGEGKNVLLSLFLFSV